MRNNFPLQVITLFCSTVTWVAWDYIFVAELNLLLHSANQLFVCAALCREMAWKSFQSAWLVLFAYSICPLRLQYHPLVLINVPAIKLKSNYVNISKTLNLVHEIPYFAWSIFSVTLNRFTQFLVQISFFTSSCRLLIIHLACNFNLVCCWSQLSHAISFVGFQVHDIGGSITSPSHLKSYAVNSCCCGTVLKIYWMYEPSCICVKLKAWKMCVQPYFPSWYVGLRNYHLHSRFCSRHLFVFH